MEQALRDAKSLESQISALVREQQWQPALDACIKAVDAFMKARSQASNTQQQKAMSERCRAMIQTGERIKKLRDGKVSLAAGEAEVRKIVESLSTLSLSSAPSEKVKTAGGGSPALDKPEPSKVTTFKTPASKRPLTRKEEMLLWKSSKLGPHKFPPWEGNPTGDMFRLGPSGETFTDANGMLTLSELQHKVFEKWRRISEIWKGKETMVLTPNPQKSVDLTQDVVTDCSVVASLCSALEREMRGIGSVFKANIWPQRNGEPVVSPNGKYIVKLWFNGCYRKVIVDDFLPTPVSESKGSLFVTSSSHPSYVLPVILEKAYLKAMGGYDFPGSNSGTDLLCLTGWIPEHLFLQPQDSDYGCDIVDQDHLWSKVYTSWGYGDVLVTLGTGNFVGGGLVAEHDYSVIGMKEFTNHKGVLERWWLVKNPWKVGGVWKGLPMDDSSSDEDEDFDVPPKENVTKNNARAAELPEPPSKSAFWIDLANVFRYFQSIYLNWNPALWRFRYDWHFVWDQKDLDKTFPSPSHGPPHYLWSAPGSFWANPQYLVRNRSNVEATTWILLSRHLVSTSEEDSSRCGWIRSGYISLYLFAADGRRVFQSSGMLKRGLYVNSPQTLLRFKIPPKMAYTMVVSSQDLLPVNASHTFSLTAFSEAPLDFEPALEPYPYTVSLVSAWTSRTAGGRKESKTYENNPMFRLTLDAASSDILLGLSVLQSDHHHKPEDKSRVETKKADAPASSSSSTPAPAIHVALLHSSGGKRVYAITRKQILADSGDYRRHFTLCKATAVPRGSYTIVVSTFQPSMISPFVLTVGSSTALQPNAVVQLGSEDSGRLKKVVEGQWGPHKKVSRKITAGRLTSVSLKFVDAAENLVRVGVWEQDMMRWTAGGWNEDDDDQEGFVEGVVRLGDFDLRPEREVGGTYIVAERMVSEDQRDGAGNGNVGEGRFQLTILSDNMIQDDAKGWVGDADD